MKTDIVARLRARWTDSRDELSCEASAELERLRSLCDSISDDAEGYLREIERLQCYRDLFNERVTEIARLNTLTIEQRAEIERLLAALQSLTHDPPATLDEPDTDAEVVIKMRAIARAAIAGKATA